MLPCGRTPPKQAYGIGGQLLTVSTGARCEIGVQFARFFSRSDSATFDLARLAVQIDEDRSFWI